MHRLKVIQPRGRFKTIALQLYRLAVLVVIVVIVRQHHVRLRIDGDAPIGLAEVRLFFPDAASLEADSSAKGGLFVLDAKSQPLGYVVRTSPQSSHIIGYSGPTDSLVAFDNAGQVVGTDIRSSWDTKEHIEDVDVNRQWSRMWKRYTWDELAKLDVEAEGIEGVSGATLTSMAMAQGIAHRVRSSADAAAASAAAPIRVTWIDGVTVALIIAAVLLTLTRLRGRRWLRLTFQFIVIGFIGFYAGLLMAQSLLSGWAMSGVAWRMAPGLVLLAGAALVLPWATRRQVYCSHLCPFGAMQEIVGRRVKWKIRVRPDVARAMRWLPAGLLALVIIVVMLNVPLNLAGIEPFDAYLITTAGWATITIAIVGLVAAAFIPQAYCKYGCPTGMLLEFVRSHGRADHFSKRDAAAGLMVLLTLVLYWQFDTIWSWIAPAARAGGDMGWVGT